MEGSKCDAVDKRSREKNTHWPLRTGTIITHPSFRLYVRCLQAIIVFHKTTVDFMHTFKYGLLYTWWKKMSHAWEDVPSRMCAQWRLFMRTTNARTRLRGCIRAVWFETSLSAWRDFVCFAIQNASSLDSDQTTPMRRLIWIFVWRTCPTVRFRRCCSNNLNIKVLIQLQQTTFWLFCIFEGK